ncbi:MAG: DUF6361 family protein [Archangium sp.]
MSSFSWIDNSEADRRRVLEALQSLQEQGTVDELGLGTIRDGFADFFFPGTSTQHTRAGYLLYIPWIYRHLHEKGVRNGDILRRGREEEIRLIDALVEDGDLTGVIGRVARQTLKNLPSAAYWAALQRFAIFERQLSLDEYHRNFETFRKAAERDEDKNCIGAHDRDWHGNLPRPPEGFPRKASFKLRTGDRQYLLERIELTVPDSLLAWLAREAKTLAGDTPWEHPQRADFPAEIGSRLLEAESFSVAMNGAAILYNLLLARKKQSDELVADYAERVTRWAEETKACEARITDWVARSIWPSITTLANVSGPTRAFVDEWLRLKPWRSGFGTEVEQLIQRREYQLKGARARLTNQRALDMWGGGSGLESTRLSLAGSPSRLARSSSGGSPC